MNTLTNTHLSYSEKYINMAAVCFSLLLSLITFFTDGFINSDGILYLNVAQAYLDNGLAATGKLYNWSFFSILIAYTHKITGFSLENSALFINALLFALLINTLINLSNKLVHNSRQLAIAAILILCFAILNEYRSFIIRDIGYWAFCCLALYRFIMFIEQPTWKNGIFWQITAVIALLFRIEGAIILTAMPLYLFFSQPPQKALLQFAKLTHLVIIGIIGITVISVNLTGFDTAFSKLTEIRAYLNIDAIFAKLTNNADLLAKQILNKFSAEYGKLILISGLLVMLLYELIIALSLSYLGIYALSFWVKVPVQTVPYKPLLYYLILINLSILSLFVIKQYFMSTRYCMLTLLLILLLLLPRLTAVIEQLWLSRNKKWLTIISILLLIGLIDSVTQSNSKSYIKDTAIWASDNLVDNSQVLTDDVFIQYYFNQGQALAQLSKITTASYKDKHYSLKQLQSVYQQYDYLIVVEKRKNKQLTAALKTMALVEIYSQQDRKGNKASVYKILPITSDK